MQASIRLVDPALRRYALCLLLTAAAGAPLMGVLTEVDVRVSPPTATAESDNTGSTEASSGITPEAAEAVDEASRMVGVPSGWYRKCDKLACHMYGYANSGYPTAYVHWTVLRNRGQAHAGDRCPPVGAFVFWGPRGANRAGHVAFVVGSDGTCAAEGIGLVTNDFGDRSTGNRGGVYRTTLFEIEQGWMSRSGYLGWTGAVCAGSRSS